MSGETITVRLNIYQAGVVAGLLASIRNQAKDDRRLDGRQREPGEDVIDELVNKAVAHVIDNIITAMIRLAADAKSEDKGGQVR